MGRGTPQSLKEAIQNGLEQWSAYLEFTPSNQITKTSADFIMSEVYEYHAHKVQVAIIEQETYGEFTRTLLRRMYDKI